MKGFDPIFKDFPDYILGITHEIWEERQVETLHKYYAENILVRSPSGIVKGNRNVIAAPYATLEEFPDRTLLGEDVIWCGNPENGMLSSHRIFSTGTHRGDGLYGPATGKTVAYQVIADCHAINNQIDDEWLVRDQGAIVRQLGRRPETFARKSIEHEGGPEECQRPFTPGIDMPGPYAGVGNDDPWGATFADILGCIMKSDQAIFETAFDRACSGSYPGGETTHGREGAHRFWTGLRGSLPNAEFAIHHQIGRDDPRMAPRVGIRWSLTGKHDGRGPFGPPSGADVHVMGISHAEFGPWGLRREWTLYDETAIWKQIILKTG